MKQTLSKLKASFSGSFVNYNGEFVAHRRANEYFSIRGCFSAFELTCSAIEYLSRACCKTRPFEDGNANITFRAFMIKGLNSFLGVDFTEIDYWKIYLRLGNGVNHKLTEAFVKNGFDLAILNRRDGDKMISVTELLETLNGLEYQASSLEQKRGGNAVLHRLIPSVIAQQRKVKICTLVNCHKCELWHEFTDKDGYGLCVRYGVKKHKGGFCDEGTERMKCDEETST